MREGREEVGKERRREKRQLLREPTDIVTKSHD